ncbi:MAG: hypothetical protein P4L83_12130 [Nevskia sp.]|nr:hypothetical protein [Nevskia sp.]
MGIKFRSVSVLVLLGGAAFALAPVAGQASSLPTVPTFYNTTIQEPHYPNFWAVGETATLTQQTWKFLGKSYSDYELSVTAPSSAIFDNNSAYYKVGSPTVQITAYFDPQGHLLNSYGTNGLLNIFALYGGKAFEDTYDIYGKGTTASSPALPASNNPTAGTPPKNSTTWSTVYSSTLNCPGSPCLLYGARLTAVGADTTHSGSVQDDALGFTIQNFSGWANKPPSYLPESLWLFLNNGGSNYTNTEITNNAAWNNFLAGIQHPGTTTLTSFTISNEVTSIATVPVPGSVWLLGAALAGLGLLRGRGRRPDPTPA